MGVGLGIGPFPERGLDEALGLAVGLRCVGPSADVPEAEDAAGRRCSSPRTIPGAIILDKENGLTIVAALDHMQRLIGKISRGACPLVPISAAVHNERAIIRA